MALVQFNRILFIYFKLSIWGQALSSPGRGVKYINRNSLRDKKKQKKEFRINLGPEKKIQISKRTTEQACSIVYKNTVQIPDPKTIYAWGRIQKPSSG